jgi:hypothetical protein
LLRELVAHKDAWEEVTFEDNSHVAPISYGRPLNAT